MNIVEKLGLLISIIFPISWIIRSLPLINIQGIIEMLIWIIGMFIFLLMTYIRSIIIHARRRDDGVGESEIFTVTSILYSHIEPQYYDYTPNTYANTNKCNQCKTVGLYEDLHVTDPCPRCGGIIKQYGACKWDRENNLWIQAPNYIDC